MASSEKRPIVEKNIFLLYSTRGEKNKTKQTKPKVACMMKRRVG